MDPLKISELGLYLLRGRMIFFFSRRQPLNREAAASKFVYANEKKMEKELIVLKFM